MSGLTCKLHETVRGARVRLLQLDRGTSRNALDLAVVEALVEALRDDPEAHVILGSTTPGTFCAGADLRVPDLERTALSDELYECYELMLRRPGLVVVAVDGAAVGGGAQLAAAADLRVAGPAARWRWVGPGHGLAVGAWILPELVGRSRALDLTLTGRWFELEEARQTGFVNRFASDAWAAALALLDEIATDQPDALASVKGGATRPQLLEALQRERERNRASWDGRAPATGAPTAETPDSA